MQSIYVIIPILVVFIFTFFRVLFEYERGVIFTLGRFWKVKGPGLIIVVPLIQKMITRMQNNQPVFGHIFLLQKQSH